MKEIKAVEVVEIIEKIKIFKNGEEANAIEVVKFKYDDGEDCGYNIIAQKDLYKVGDKGVYCQPDYCVSDTLLFDSFIRPFGDPKKTKLGRNFRIRAVKFNFSFENMVDPIYSFGILLPLSEVESYLRKPISDFPDLADALGIVKYEEPETGSSGMIAGDFPSDMYKTDESNWNNSIGPIRRAIEGGEIFGVSIKRDGSSITLKFNKDDDWKHRIFSRNQEKSIEQSYTSLYVDSFGFEFHKYIDPTTKQKGWINDESGTFLTNEWCEENLTPVKVDVRDSWVDVATNNGYVEKLLNYCKKYDVELVFRGELIGQGLKGSGNKLNPDSGIKQTIILFGVDNIETGFSVRNHYGNEHNLEKICKEVDLPYTESQWIKPNSIEELEDFCKKIIKNEENNGRMIEGVVVRTKYSNKISVKYLSPKYDEKK